MQEFNIISISTIGQDIELISEKKGIALSRDPFLVREHLKILGQPQFVEEITLLLVRKGSAKIRINLEEVFITKNCFILLMPNNIAEMLEYDENLEVDVLLFSYDAIVDLPLTKELGNIGDIVNGQPSLLLCEADFQELSNFYSFLAYHCNKEGTLQNGIAKNILYALCYFVLQCYQSSVKIAASNKSRSEIIYKNFFSLLYKHYKEERAIQFYADQLHITAKYFSKVIKRISRKNASCLIDEMVIMGIKASLKCTDKTVLQISEEFNFLNPSFFGTYFKKRTGITPLYYRINNSNV